MPKPSLNELKTKLDAVKQSIAALVAANMPDAILAPLRQQAADLVQQIETAGGAVVQGDVEAETFIGRDLNITLNGVYAGPDPDSQEKAERIYRNVLAYRFGELTLRGLDPAPMDPTSGRRSLSLSQVYIELDIVGDLRSNGAVAFQDVEFPDEEIAGANEAEEDRPTTALLAATLNRRVVLLGKPGSGKSTFVSHFAYCLAARKYETLKGWPAVERNALPVVVILREFARWILSRPEAERTPAPRLLLQFIAHDLAERNLGFMDGYLQTGLEAGAIVVVLDGLDEAPPAQRDLIKAAVEAFAGRYPASRFIVTCRVLSYQQPEWQLSADLFPVYELAPFDEKKIDGFIAAWYAEVAAKWKKTTTETDDLARSLRQAVRQRDLQRLAPNPLLLTVMALVHTTDNHLPEQRALLYERTVDILLFQWEQVKEGDPRTRPLLTQLLKEVDRNQNDLRARLEELAFAAHQSGGDTTDPDAAAGIGRLQLLNTLRTLHPIGSLDWAERVVEAMKLRAGLLVEQLGDVFAFPHRTFQEHLAGVYLARQPNCGRAAAQLASQGAFWRDVILLAVGYLVHKTRDHEKALSIIDELCSYDSPADDSGWRRAWLAGEALLELGLNRARDAGERGVQLLKRGQTRLTELVETGRLSPRERAEAGDVLGKLGDPRFGPDVFFLPRRYRNQPEPTQGLVEIPPGPFVMGSKQGDKEAFDTEFGNPKQLEIIYRYWLARYPVTVAQFGCFVEAKGYDDSQWWTPAGWAWRKGEWDSTVEGKNLRQWLEGRPTELRGQPMYWEGQLPFPNRPVVYVSWFESLAYCKWLDAQLRNSGPANLLPKGYTVRLPTEAEWEKAARTSDGRRYPWGNEDWDENRANIQNRIGHTSTVGLYPGGATPSGLHDLSGNAWEWTYTLFKPYPYAKDDRNDENAEGRRAVRGGSFILNPRDARCAYRARGVPDYFYFNIGFRVCVSLAVSGF